MGYWFVNQGASYTEERKGGFIYAPKTNERGTMLQHWFNVKLVKKGDIIFCNNKGKILSVAKALSDGYESVIPNSIEGMWNSYGFKADLQYLDLRNPFHFSDYKDQYMSEINFDNNPFNVLGNAKMGYLFPMEEKIARYFVEKINEDTISKYVFAHDNRISYEFVELQEETEQFEDINKGIIKTYSKEELAIKELEEYEYVPRIDNSNQRVLREKTDAKLKATRMELANYCCEINNNHVTFTNVSGQHQYLECHHIIPLCAQKDFPNVKLDSMFNIIAVCPICHMQVHHATIQEKGEIFSKMYNARKDEMLKYGFDLSKINDIFNKYYLNKKDY